MYGIDKTDPEAHIHSLLATLKGVLADTRNPSIDLDTFASKWLPLLLSKVDPTVQANGGPPIQMWIDQIAGSAFTRVDVVKDGKIVYTVPPILNSDALVLPPKMTYYERIMYLKSVAATQVPAEAMRAVEKHLVSAVGRDVNADTYIKEMNVIAVYHGYPPLIPVTDEVARHEDNSPVEIKFQSDF